MSSLPARIIVLSVIVGLALSAFGGVSFAANPCDPPALQRSGSDSPGQSDNPSDGTGAKGEFGSGGSGAAAGKSCASGPRAGSLPFTGYLAIPAALAGVALLGTGVVLRRRGV